MDMFLTSWFWVTLGQIIMINILLSGDNAVVIALASRNLPPKQQRQAILFGSFGAIILRVILTFFAVVLLAFPYLKIVGGILLVWIGVKMLVPENDDEELDGHTGLWAAIKTIIIADFIMSLDNVLGVAAAAKGNTVLLVIGLAISIPLIIYGSTLVLKLMERFGFIVVLGAGLLGWVAGEMLITDPAIVNWVEVQATWAHTVVPTALALFVVTVGLWLARNNGSAEPELVAVPVPADVPALAPQSERGIESAATPTAFAAQAPATSNPQSHAHAAAPAPVTNANLHKQELPIGYRDIATPWHTLPDGHRVYAAMEGKDAYHRLAPVSSRIKPGPRH